MGRIAVTRSVPGDALELLRDAGHFIHLWPDETPPPPADLAAMLGEADGTLTMVTDRVTPVMLAASPRLRVIANMAVGYDNVDPGAAAEAGVWLTNTPGILAETTADLAFGLLLAGARQIALSDRDTRAGGWKAWSPTAFLGNDVHGATLGIIGLGEIGTAVARRATGFGMCVLHTSRTAKPQAEQETGAVRVPLDQLLRESDFVSLHVPLTQETRALLGEREFLLMKRSAILVNTARGTVIDQDALVHALRSGYIGGAALDVTDPEPLPLNHPLYAFPNVVITPHIGSASFATRSRMAELAARNIISVLSGGEPLTPVNRPSNPRV